MTRKTELPRNAQKLYPRIQCPHCKSRGRILEEDRRDGFKGVFEEKECFFCEPGKDDTMMKSS